MDKNINKEIIGYNKITQAVNLTKKVTTNNLEEYEIYMKDLRNGIKIYDTLC